MKKYYFLSAVILIFLIYYLGLFIGSQQISSYSYSLGNYVADNYIPTQKSNKGKWVENLNYLEIYIRSEEDFSEENLRLKRILKGYKQMKSFEIIKSGKKFLLFRLRMQDRILDCKSTIDPNEGYCK